MDKLVKKAPVFTTLRTETARLGVEAAPSAAADQGFTEVNRANRQAFQDGIDALVARGRTEVEGFVAGIRVA